MDAAEFRRASRAVWDSMATGWDSHHAFFEEVARPVTERMLERLAPEDGETLLELAGGTGVAGFAAAEAVGSSGHVVISDFSRAMVDAAERQAAERGVDNVECRVLDAESLDLPDDSFDGALCRWGYMLLADPVAGLRETRRVLRPEGRVACAVFAEGAKNPWAAIPSAVLVERGHMPPPEVGAPGILALADRERLRELFTEAGFADTEIEEVPVQFQFEDVEEYWEFMTDVAGAIAMVLRRLDHDERERVRDLVGERLASFEGEGGLGMPSTSLVVAAA